MEFELVKTPGLAWTELITYYLFTNPLSIKDFSPDICVINFVLLLTILALNSQFLILKRVGCISFTFIYKQRIIRTFGSTLTTRKDLRNIFKT